MQRSLVSLFFLVVACGPNARSDDSSDDDGGGPDAAWCTPTAATETDCTDGFDQDCDQFIDCQDVDCQGNEICPGSNCGELDAPLGSLYLPDGETAPPLTDAITFTGFSAGQTLQHGDDILGVMVKMEHTWLRDLQIDIICPNGQRLVLQQMLGQTGSELFMGEPNLTDQMVPGVGWEYWWRPTATMPPMLTYANMNPGMHDMPSGDYQAAGSDWDVLVGCPLNGDWTIYVDDLWNADNGYIFEWTLSFDPAIVENCEDWPPTE